MVSPTGATLDLAILAYSSAADRALTMAAIIYTATKRCGMCCSKAVRVSSMYRSTEVMRPLA